MVGYVTSVMAIVRAERRAVSVIFLTLPLVISLDFFCQPKFFEMCLVRNTIAKLSIQFNSIQFYFILQHNINEYNFAKALTKFDIITKIFSYKAMTLEYSTHVKLDKA